MTCKQLHGVLSVYFFLLLSPKTKFFNPLQSPPFLTIIISDGAQGVINDMCLIYICDCVLAGNELQSKLYKRILANPQACVILFEGNTKIPVKREKKVCRKHIFSKTIFHYDVFVEQLAPRRLSQCRTAARRKQMMHRPRNIKPN